MRPTLSLLALVLAALLATAATRPEPHAERPGEDGRLVETQRVTAFDLLVEIAERREPDVSVEPSAGARDRLTLLWDGAPLPILDAAPGRRDTEPWRTVIYIDRVLSSDPTVRWATMELAERARRLTALGEVEIVVADPEPRRVLAPGRDAQLLDEALSGIFLAPGGGNELVARREEHLLEYPRADAGGGSGKAAGRAAGMAARAEAHTVRGQLDRLLDWLVDAAPPTPRRALLLVGDGFDLRPGEFYAAGSATAAERGAVDLGEATRELGETLGAYGWVVGALAPPPPAIGTGRFGVYLVREPGLFWVFKWNLRSIAVWLDRNRNVKKADAFAELGRTLRAQERLDDAIAAYGKSIYHYYDHPKTARRQAAALVGLGETYLLRGDRREARQAFRAAVVFDDELAPSYPFVAAKLLAPQRPLARLAELSAGGVVVDRPALDRLLDSLGNRLRLTSQLAGQPDGALHALELRFERPAFLLRHPRVARWGTPPAVAALRLRRLLAGEPTAGELDVDAVAAGGAGPEARRIEVRVASRAADKPHDGSPAPSLALSWATGGPGSAPRYGLRSASLEPPRGGDGESRVLTLEVPAGGPWLAVVAEDLQGGAWGGALLELDAR